MSFISPEQMAYKDSANLDAFGRLRVSTGAQLFGLSQEYTQHPLVWDHYTASGGTVTYVQARGSSVLSTAGSTSGARAIRQTKAYLRYTPGKSQLVKRTGVLRKGAAPLLTAFCGLGYYDDNNGLFFKDSAAGVAVVRRSNVSGSVVDEVVLQPAWNIDRFDGTGPSGKTVDWTKGQIFVIDMQWLGDGRVRFGLNIDGTLFYCHQMLHANVISSVYMKTANLPLRTEAFNSGGTGSNVSVETTCDEVESEGGVDEMAVYPFSYSAYIASPLSIDTTLRPLVTRRLRDTFNGLTVRGTSRLKEWLIVAKTNDVYWEIRYNQTVALGTGGSATTSDVDSTYSITEYDTYAGAANTVSGGELMYCGIVTAGSGVVRGASAQTGVMSMWQLGRTYSGTRDQFTLSARALTSTASVSVCVQLEEQY